MDDSKDIKVEVMKADEPIVPEEKLLPEEPEEPEVVEKKPDTPPKPILKTPQKPAYQRPVYQRPTPPAKPVEKSPVKEATPDIEKTPEKINPMLKKNPLLGSLAAGGIKLGTFGFANSSKKNPLLKLGTPSKSPAKNLEEERKKKEEEEEEAKKQEEEERKRKEDEEEAKKKAAYPARPVGKTPVKRRI